MLTDQVVDFRLGSLEADILLSRSGPHAMGARRPLPRGLLLSLQKHASYPSN
jgi:hypothetical protein